MKKYLLITVLLAGCASNPVVNKPIALIPVPPDVPELTYRVDQLTPDSSPGDVAQAYRYDMTALRGVVKIYRAILEEYKKGSVSFDEVNKQIDELVKK